MRFGRIQSLISVIFSGDIGFFKASANWAIQPYFIFPLQATCRVIRHLWRFLKRNKGRQEQAAREFL
jgi:hypothetical protein